MSDGKTILSKEETLITNIDIIIKKDGMNEAEVKELFTNMQINLQFGICKRSLNSHLDISRNISCNYPVYYKEK